jgi:enamine deaminase RidA (YjgF/YER057c/UK114 family)
MRRIQQSKRFSQATISKNHIYLTGQVAIDNPNGTIGEQTMEVLNRIDTLLNEAETDKKAILIANIWLRDMMDYDEMNKIWDNWIIDGYAPARACVQSVLVSSFKVEISVVAETP